MHSAKSCSGNRGSGGNNLNRSHDKSWNDTEGSSKREALKKITSLRQKIDEIDGKILLLLKERVEIAQKIGEIKRKQGVPIRDPKREREKYKQITAKASELKLNPEDVKEIYRKIIDMSIHSQGQLCENENPSRH